MSGAKKLLTGLVLVAAIFPSQSAARSYDSRFDVTHSTYQSRGSPQLGLSSQRLYVQAQPDADQVPGGSSRQSFCTPA